MLSWTGTKAFVRLLTVGLSSSNLMSLFANRMLSRELFIHAMINCTNLILEYALHKFIHS